MLKLNFRYQASNQGLLIHIYFSCIPKWERYHRYKLIDNAGNTDVGDLDGSSIGPEKTIRTYFSKSFIARSLEECAR